MSDATCISCGMPLRSPADRPAGHADSAWCVHCATPEGLLQDFQERFERMVQWQMKKKGSDRPQAEVATREYMRSMPAWKDHPRLA